MQIRDAERKAEATQLAENKDAAALQLAKEAWPQASRDDRDGEAAWTLAQEELTALRTKQLPEGTDAKAAGNGAMPLFSVSHKAMQMPCEAVQMA